RAPIARSSQKRPSLLAGQGESEERRSDAIASLQHHRRSMLQALHWRLGAHLESAREMLGKSGDPFGEGELAVAWRLRGRVAGRPPPPHALRPAGKLRRRYRIQRGKEPHIGPVQEGE